MRQPLLLDLYNALPDRHLGDTPSETAHRIRRGLNRFRKAVEGRYQQATLERLLSCPEVEVRQAAVLALGLVGTYQINPSLAARLHDDDPTVRELCVDALWSVWFRADTDENNRELQRLMQMKVREESVEEILAGYEALIRKSPRFAEAHNQRAIVYYRLCNFPRAVADCEKTLRLNPFHFGAANGMAQCFMKQKKLRAALRSYRRANRINPNLDGIPQTIESLERMLGEKGS